MQHFDTDALVRTVLTFAHVLAFALAVAAIALGDFAIFSGDRVDAVLLNRSAGVVNLALAGLWVTGLGVIGLSTGFDLAALGAKPKLLAKLNVVALLTLNGLALNLFAFPRLAQAHTDPLRSAVLPAVLGAVSATTWVFAAFLGVARGLEGAFGYAGFMALYLVALALGIGLALRFVLPRLSRQMPVPGLPSGMT